MVLLMVLRKVLISTLVMTMNPLKRSIGFIKI